jgi:hypothetical protein
MQRGTIWRQIFERLTWSIDVGLLEHIEDKPASREVVS